MKIVKHGCLALFSMLIGLVSYGQDEKQRSEMENDTMVSNYHMKNRGILTYERRKPNCDFVKNENQDSDKIICDFEANPETSRRAAGEGEKGRLHRSNMETAKNGINDTQKGLKKEN